MHRLIVDRRLAPSSFEVNEGATAIGMNVRMHDCLDQQLLLSQTSADSGASTNNRVTIERVKDPCSVETVSALLDAVISNLRADVVRNFWLQLPPFSMRAASPACF